MNRILTGAALALALIGSATAYAATTTPAPTTAAAPKVDYAAKCTSLADQWKTAEAANASNANLGKAKADATKAEKQCKSTKASDQKKGVANYEAALKLLGVTPS
jgi:hypothetical protein